MTEVLHLKRRLGRAFRLSGTLALAALLGILVPATAQARQKTQTTSSNCTTLPDGLISWWTADGTAEDFQSNHDGTLMNGATYDEGVMGKAFKFDGQDDYIRLPDSFFAYPDAGVGNDSFTFSVWFKTDGPGAIFSQNRPDGDPSGAHPSGWSPGLYVGTDGKLYAEMFWGDVEAYRSATTVTDGQFHHVAITYEGAAHYQGVYLDGQRLVRRPYTQLGYVAPFTFYRYQFGTGFTRNRPETNWDWFFFEGMLDEIQLYDRALSDGEIQTLFEAREGGYCSYTISGRVTNVCGQGVAGVQVSMSYLDSTTSAVPVPPPPTRTAITDANGFYRFDRVPRGGDYLVQPPKGQQYSPAKHSFEDLSSNQTANFIDQTPVLWCPPTL